MFSIRFLNLDVPVPGLMIEFAWPPSAHPK